MAGGVSGKGKRGGYPLSLYPPPFSRALIGHSNTDAFPKKRGGSLLSGYFSSPKPSLAARIRFNHSLRASS
jgi:hypothetical protein